MTRNLSDRPHRTPHPDQPHAMGPGKERNPAPGRPSAAEPESDVPNYDSRVDDLNRLLSVSIEEPDPNLESATPSENSSPSSVTDGSVAGFGSDRGKPPRTSEVFQAVGPLVVDVPSAMSSRTVRAQTAPSGDSPGTVPRVELISDRLPASGRSLEDQPGGSGSTDTDDQSNRSPFPWMQLLLLSYSSALTLALTWAIWQGKFRPSPVSQSTDSSSSEIESTTSANEPNPVGPTPPIPIENLTTLGKTIHIGDLEVTPLSVVIAPLTLVRTIEPSTKRDADGSSLVLRLRLTNISKDRTFAPLERGFLRDPISPLDRAYIETAKGDRIGLFPLANDSEWSIRGQEFPTLKPGESAETIIGSEPTDADRLSSEMTWRVRLRIGTYRTDLVGVQLTSDDFASSSRGFHY